MFLDCGYQTHTLELELPYVLELEFGFSHSLKAYLCGLIVWKHAQYILNSDTVSLNNLSLNIRRRVRSLDESSFDSVPTPEAFS